ncbi:UvrD-helicase domain-containing protein [soil metagenome]
MPLPPHLDIYKASAGSGKTFLLTLQYLKLLFERPTNYRHILAVTFTNKATAEMKERILRELQSLAKGEITIIGEKLLEAMPSQTAVSLQQQAKTIYSSILHDYSRFAVTTIDSFVQKIIRSFAFEIGLDAGFKLKLNTEIVKEDLAGRLFRLLDTDASLRHWVTELAVKRLSEGKNWNFREDMLELAGELFKEPFQEFEAALKTLPDVNGAFKSLRQKVFSVINEFEKKWKETGEQALQLLSANSLSELDFYYGKAGFINYFYKAATSVIEQPGTRVKAIMEDPGMMGGKKPHPGIATIQNQLHQLLMMLCTQCETDFEKYNTALVLSKNVGNLRLMQVFSEQLSFYRSENNELLISDTHLLLRQLTRETEASFIYEKTGNRFKHYLIDEFQDTSGFQWDNFKPLLENTLAEGNYNLLVGDIKQAIYRWRSGDWQLLQNKVSKQLNSFDVEIHSLQDNRRSAKPIIQFNNFLYRALPHLLQVELNNLINKAPESMRDKLAADGFNHIIKSAYAESKQQVPTGAEENGLVDIQFLLKDEALSYDEVMLPLLFEKITGLLQEGFMAKDIAVLTRNNREATRVIEYLMNAQQENALQFDLLSSDALLLANNNAVSLIVMAMELLIGVGGKLALANLRHLFARQNDLPASDYHLYVCKEEDEAVLPPSFFAAKAELHRLPLPELVSAIIRIFDLNKNPYDAAYLLAFQDLVGEWNRFGSEGLQNFLTYWEDEGKAKSLPGGANTNAVEVLTIHKSKGLAFAILLLPYLNWQIKPEAIKNIQLWVKTAGTPFDDVPLVPVRYGETLQQTFFAYSYFEELLLGMMDNLNLLYVATTRARRRIIGWSPKPDKTENLNCLEKLLYAAATERINDDEALYEEAGKSNNDPDIQDCFDTITGQWLFGSDIKAPELKPVSVPELLPIMEQSNWKHRLTVKFQSLQTEQEMEQQLPRKQGVLLHEALAQLTEANALDRVMLQMKQQGLMNPSQQQQVRSTLEEILAQPILDGWRNGTMQRLSEREIITAKKEIRRPDLVLYNTNETIVIDFKFTDDQTANERYRQQVSEYVNLLTKTGFKFPSGYLLYAGNKVGLVKVI